MKDVKDMTHAEKSSLIDELMPCIVQKLMNTSSVIVNDGEKAVILPVRFLNSHQISTESRGDLDTAIAEADSATTIAALKVAVKNGLNAFKRIAVGGE